jgi:nicotinamidase-related amidase
MQPKLTIENTLLIVVDVQGKLAHAMAAKEKFFDNLIKMIKGAQILGIPILLTEQNPKGLGPTIPEVADLLKNLKPISKYSFSCCDNDRFMQALDSLGPKNILIAGIETHICVFQTARDLANLQYRVQIVADAVSSRTIENNQIGLEKCKNTGAELTSVETILFELLKDAQQSEFKEILELVK